MFCRSDREQKCLMLLKDRDGQPVYDSKGELWHQPALGLSRKSRDYDEVGGNTPAGVLTINGVMPSANKQKSFGKFRRLKLDFVRASKGERHYNLLLPPSSHALTWWHESVVARNIGRSLLRIHGTGRKSRWSWKPYHPFVRTIGCVAQRENTYDGIEYKDQRKLLDALMQAQGLAVEYRSERKIKGLLYLVEIDGREAPVSLADLKKLGIK